MNLVNNNPIHIIMKKERTLLFPEIESFTVASKDEYQIQLTDFLPGKIYRIGRPSTKYYQHIRPFIVPEEFSERESDDFKKILGLIVKVTSIISLVNGKRIAVLRHYEDKLLLDKFEKIFAHVQMSTISLEIIHLDLETKRTLESVSNSKS